MVHLTPPRSRTHSNKSQNFKKTGLDTIRLSMCAAICQAFIPDMLALRSSRRQASPPSLSHLSFFCVVFLGRSLLFLFVRCHERPPPSLLMLILSQSPFDTCLTSSLLSPVSRLEPCLTSTFDCDTFFHRRHPKQDYYPRSGYR